ncbi:hypothetical protein [Rhizobium mongolense]|uniref:hypothetical protein n=1 Tax=Rhizobium mongolense TaxID=57676 RepID=UPI0034A504F6
MLGVEIAAAGLIVLGALIPLLLPRPVKIEFGATPDGSGVKILFALAGLTLAFGVFCGIYYWRSIELRPDEAIFGVALFLAMVAGMTVQVLAANYRAGNPLFSVSRDQVIFPLLFSVIVFYPIWALTAEAPKGLFPLHASFLNGYFWESIVASAKPKK